MAGTRSSARLKASAAPKNNDDQPSSAEEEAAKPNGNKSTRRKRGRADDEHVAQDSRPAKKHPRRERKANPRKSKQNTPKASKESKSIPKAPKPSNATKSKSTPLPAPTRSPNSPQETFWLLKAEPLPRYENGINVSFSISDLRACTAPEPWSGVRNPQARNNMQAMRAGDLGFFYHSNAKPSGIAGILRVVEEAKVDETAFDPKDPYYDAKSEREKPKWFCVGVEFVREFDEVLDLKRIKECAKEGGALKDMQLVTQSRLSVCRVSREEWEYILGMVDGEKKKE
ncbi:uncharacterized protein SETTUDRAFT_156016 [Exserohilum turcica Et28A]|uniref:Thymocyte nuclear protein 1 n=1 Tax=Exserohilum turcicum (strain 28A) TaxID=671987 RepID=R0K543_EXST2|nr:uncharacterized protein SETTUDRAFT_156016 [Exserohilum turcica Et28A]EOA83492.1 hypothetical protein SETTUDRAFT_156016 [Exserohilum turcica Et28A]